MKQKLIKAAMVMALLVVLFIAGGFTGYSWCKNSQLKGVITQQEDDAKKVFEHEEIKTKAIDEVDTLITNGVQKLGKSDNCLNKPSDADYLNGLLSADSAAESSFN